MGVALGPLGVAVVLTPAAVAAAGTAQSAIAPAHNWAPTRQQIPVLSRCPMPMS
jgi:hypothetical protein